MIHARDGYAFMAFQGPVPLEDVLFIAQKACRFAPLQCIRADRVVGERHLEHAVKLAKRAFEAGTAHAKTLEVEFLRYAAGERQIKHAISKMGMTDEVEVGLAVAIGAKAVDALQYFEDGLGLLLVEGWPKDDEAALLEFDIPITAIEATTPSRRLDLVLERISEVGMVK